MRSTVTGFYSSLHLHYAIVVRSLVNDPLCSCDHLSLTCPPTSCVRNPVRSASCARILRNFVESSFNGLEYSSPYCCPAYSVTSSSFSEAKPQLHQRLFIPSNELCFARKLCCSLCSLSFRENRTWRHTVSVKSGNVRRMFGVILAFCFLELLIIP